MVEHLEIWLRPHLRMSECPTDVEITVLATSIATTARSVLERQTSCRQETWTEGAFVSQGVETSHMPDLLIPGKNTLAVHGTKRTCGVRATSTSDCLLRRRAIPALSRNDDSRPPRSPIPGQSWLWRIDSKATSRPSTDWSSDVRSWQARSATCSPGEGRRQGLAACDRPVQQGHHGGDDRRRTALEAGSRLRGAQELGCRRGRLVAGRDRESGGRKTARRVRTTTCCRRPGSVGERSV